MAPIIFLYMMQAAIESLHESVHATDLNSDHSLPKINAPNQYGRLSVQPNLK